MTPKELLVKVTPTKVAVIRLLADEGPIPFAVAIDCAYLADFAIDILRRMARHDYVGAGDLQELFEKHFGEDEKDVEDTPE